MNRMKKRNLKAYACILACLGMAFLYLPKTYAYVFNGYVLSSPTNIRYIISTSVGGFTSGMSNYVEIWEGFCPEVSITQNNSWTGTENISIYGELNLNNGTYAACTHTNNNRHSITIYQAYTQATAAVQHETIVHEVGHALGLAHCQPAQESNSVMRATGFNNKPYPLSDERSGITALYGN